MLVGATSGRPHCSGSGCSGGFSPARLAAVILHVLVRFAVVVVFIGGPPRAVAVLVLAVRSSSSASSASLAFVHRLQLEQVLRGEPGSLFSTRVGCF